MAVGDIYVVKMLGTFLLQQSLNVFYYRTNFQAGGDGAPELFTAFDTVIMSEWAQTVIIGVTVPALEVFATNNPTDFFTAAPANSIGLRPDLATDRLPSWVTFSYKSNRAGPGSRSSYKRFTGLQEDDQQANVLSPAFLAIPAVDDLRIEMGNLLASPGGTLWEPVQVNSGWTLAIPPSVNFVITDWLDPTLSSQTSRKP